MQKILQTSLVTTNRNSQKTTHEIRWAKKWYIVNFQISKIAKLIFSFSDRIFKKIVQTKILKLVKNPSHN